MSKCSSCSTCASRILPVELLQKNLQISSLLWQVMSGKGGVVTTTVLLAKTLASKDIKLG